MPRRLALLPPILLLALVAGAFAGAFAGTARAQQNTVIQAENVRFAYAQVLRVTPVYQILTATRLEQRCDQSPSPDSEGSRLSRVVGAVKGVLSRDEEDPDSNCRSIPVEREFRRPIAYDVDYTYKGAKYRSRLPEDPGNRLRIRVSVTPVIGGTRTR